MPRLSSRALFKKLWKPAAATGAGGTAIAIWIEEILLIAQELLAFVFLFLMAGVVYLLNLLMFKTRMPKK